MAGCTTAVAFEETGPAEPEPLLPVTATTMRRADIGRDELCRSDDVAAMFAQFRPLLSQRCH